MECVVEAEGFMIFLVFLVGSGRVTFDNHKSFMMAVRSGFIEIETPKFTKKVTYRSQLH